MSNLSKARLKALKGPVNRTPYNPRNDVSILERKAYFLGDSTGKRRQKYLLKYYKSTSLYSRYRILCFIDKLATKRIKFIYFDFLRWLLVDLLRGKQKRSFGIYQFVALPSEGKTMSMVAHMERFRADMERRGEKYVIATNFNYKHQSYKIAHWLDMVKIAKDCYKNHIYCLIAMDEIHVTFDSSAWKDFPAEMLAMLSFNRKYGLQFICSSQIYERIPKKIRDIANFTVICKNVLHSDRYFRNYYFAKTDYESQFEGKKAKCKFIKEFIADDNFYKLYDTLEQVDNMTENAQKEKNAKEKAFAILFGKEEEEEAGTRMA